MGIYKSTHTRIICDICKQEVVKVQYCIEQLIPFLICKGLRLTVYKGKISILGRVIICKDCEKEIRERVNK